MEGKGHTLQEFGREAIRTGSLVRREAREALVVESGGDGREDGCAGAFGVEREGVGVGWVRPREADGGGCGGDFGEGGGGKGVNSGDHRLWGGVEGTSNITYRHEFTFGGVVGVAAEDEIDSLLGLVVVEGGEVLSVVCACLVVGYVRIPCSLFLVGGVQRLEGGGRELMEGGRS
jgi:hypothetical protein